MNKGIQGSLLFFRDSNRFYPQVAHEGCCHVCPVEGEDVEKFKAVLHQF